MDIQLPRNIDNEDQRTQWAVIDTSRFSDLRLIHDFCREVSVICVHVFASDLIELSIEEIFNQMQPINDTGKRTIVLVRDINDLDQA